MRLSGIASIGAVACVFVVGIASWAIEATNAEDFAPEAPPVAVDRSQIVMMGNSITLHGPKVALGWAGNYGMAAPMRPNR
jgi:hypothetical protein